MNKHEIFFYHEGQRVLFTRKTILWFYMLDSLVIEIR